jgi:hypothetical protein
MAKISGKGIIASMALIAAGIPVIMLWVSLGNIWDHLLESVAIQFSGFALVGAGIFCPAKRTIEGALIGIMLAFSVVGAGFVSCVP